MMRRRSLDDSSSAWPGAVSAFRLIEYCRFERVMRVGPNPRSSRAMLSIRTGWPDRRSDGELADHVDVAALALQHADRDRVLFAGFAIRRDLVVAGHHQPERVADRRHAHTQVGRARPIHGHLHLGAGIAVVGFRVDEARGLLGLLDNLLRVPCRACRDRGRAAPPGARSCRRRRADSGPRCLRRSAGWRASTRRTCVMICACVTFRSFEGCR